MHDDSTTPMHTRNRAGKPLKIYIVYEFYVANISLLTHMLFSLLRYFPGLSNKLVINAGCILFINLLKLCVFKLLIDLGSRTLDEVQLYVMPMPDRLFSLSLQS